MKFGIVVFPGSNCDADCHHVAKDLLGCEADYIWHEDKDLKGADAVILPGGFAYGDYLRAGALARFSPVMEAWRISRRRAAPVLGICNGFQVLLEAGLLPGSDADQPRPALRLPRHPHAGRERRDTPFTSLYAKGEVVTMPIGHVEGNYTAPPEIAGRARAGAPRRLPLLRRARAASSTPANPNGAARGIAGIANREGNVVGLMPHPDRCSEGLLGNAAGIKMFESAVRFAAT